MKPKGTKKTTDKFPKFKSQQADLISEAVRKFVGPQITDLFDDYGINVNHMIRFRYIAKLCQRTREEKSLSIKQASSKLKIPQYRLKAIERGGVKDIVPDHLERYIDFLEVRDEFNDWLKENKDAYDGIVNKSAK
jgi:ribosome-binding protein aMBF1 (putative translation factor)